MYEQFFGLQRRAFELTNDSRFLYLSRTHREALGALRYALTGRAGITALIGEVGMGKTTAVRAALSHRGGTARVVYLTNPLVNREEFFEFLRAGFELTTSSRSKTQFLLELSRLLVRRRESGDVPSLVVDEAQILSNELMEEIRLLANIESSDRQLLSIVLVGQPELWDRLNERSLRQLKQRIALRCVLKPFDREETAAYIQTRLRAAGSAGVNPFTPEAVHRIHERSHGLPRLISVICDNTLLAAYAAQRRSVDDAMVEEVCGDLDLTQPAAAPAPPVQLRSTAARPMRPASTAVGSAAGPPAGPVARPDVERAARPAATDVAVRATPRPMPVRHAPPARFPEPARSAVATTFSPPVTDVSPPHVRRAAPPPLGPRPDATHLPPAPPPSWAAVDTAAWLPPVIPV